MSDREFEGKPCVFPGCTGVFVPENQVMDYTGWSYSPAEPWDIPAHDCRTEDEG